VNIMDTKTDNNLIIRDVSPIYKVDFTLFGNKSTMGFTISYSDGTIVNVLKSELDSAADIGSLKKKRQEFLAKWRKQENR